MTLDHTAGLLLVVLAGVASAACAPATKAGAATAETRSAPVARGERAGYYGGPAQEANLTEAEQTLWSAVVGTNPTCRCAKDPRLILTARRHAADLASSGRPPNDSDLEHLRFALRAVGGTDYALQPLVIPTDERGRSSLAAFVLAHGDRWTHCGLGLSGVEDNRVAVWIGVERSIELGPLPLRPPVGVELEVVGRTLTGRPVPIEPFLGLPDGTVRRLNPRNGWSGVSGGRFSIKLPLEAEGRYDFELMVDTGRGPETTVLLPLYVGVEPEPGPVIALDAPPGATDRSAIESLSELIDRDRKRVGLAPLERDPRLDRIAASHSNDMVARSFFGHRSPDGEVLADRLQQMGLRPANSAENIARSRS
ncbi:MAG: CAP domain-containing protein, partial [Deltaproteobacteria bacterium]|nr:CAP domain-containing protein [Deltaproteobacteria bacterium]